MHYTRELPPGRYGMLLRKSREDAEAEREGRYETLALHEGQLRRLADSYGVTIAEEDVYRELKSGELLSECAEVTRCIRAVAQGRYAGIFAVNLKRLTRGDMIDQGTIIRAFSASHALVITPDRHPYDLSDPSDRSLTEFQLLHGRMELGDITRQFLAGKLNKLAEGQYIAARAPFGWDKVVTGRKKTVAPNSDAPMVAQWYADVAAGRETARSIATGLNARHVPSPNGGAWTPNVVSAILRNPVNKGCVRYGLQRTEIALDEQLRQVKRRVPTGEAKVVDGLHEGIVPEELWQRAVDAIEGRTSPAVRRQQPLRDPLAGLLKCSGCGRGMHRRLAYASGGGVRYQHPDANRHECWQVGTAVSKVVGLLGEALAGMAEEIEAPVGSRDDMAAMEGRRAMLEDDAAGAKRGIANLLRLAEKGMVSDEEFAERRAVLDARAREAEEQLRKLTEEMEGSLTREERVYRLREAMAALPDYERDVEAANRMLKAIVRRIDYSKSDGKVQLNVLLR